MSQQINGRRLGLLCVMLAAAFPVLAAPLEGAGTDDGGKPAWLPAMRAVHAKHTGKKGTLAQFGDSITVTSAYWSPLQWAKAKEMDAPTAAALAVVSRYISKDSWNWKGPEFGSEGGKTIAWAAKGVDGWLKKLNPETVLIMFGTNDLTNVKADEYEAKLREVAKKCLANGSVTMLSTIPPRHDMLEKSKAYSAIVRKVAGEMNLPLIDYETEILKRQPDDWDGAVKFKGAKNVYDVETLISADGVHPSLPKKWEDFSEEALKNNGYNLRTWLTLKAYSEVVEKVLEGKK